MNNIDITLEQVREFMWLLGRICIGLGAFHLTGVFTGIPGEWEYVAWDFGIGIPALLFCWWTWPERPKLNDKQIEEVLRDPWRRDSDGRT